MSIELINQEMSREEAIAILKEIAEWSEESSAYLSTGTDWAKGYRAGIFQAKEIVSSMLSTKHTDAKSLGI